MPVRARVGRPSFISPSEFRWGDQYRIGLVLQYWYHLGVGSVKLSSVPLISQPTTAGPNKQHKMKYALKLGLQGLLLAEKKSLGCS